MERRTETRREFLKHTSIALAAPLIFGCGGSSTAQVSRAGSLGGLKANAIADPGCEWCGARDVPDTVSSRTSLVGQDDTAERIRISGTIYQPDGKTAAAGTLIYLYHTDVFGVYGRGGQHRHGRYRGWMLTDERGRYEFESIMPASYPNSTIAKHIHMTLTTKELKEDWVDSILFEGDRFLTSRDRAVRRGGFDPVLKMSKASDGMLWGVRDIRLGA